MTLKPCCKKDKVFNRPHEGRSLCRDHFMESFEKTVKRTIRKNELFDSGDKIAVALSGGKDSSVVLYLLKKILGERRDIEIAALSIDEGISGYRDPTIQDAKDLCEELDVEHIIVSFQEEFGETLDEIKKSGAPLGMCTYCGVFRRYLMNREARKWGATKLAVGHNLDDEVQSAMMNYINGDVGRLRRSGAKTNNPSGGKFVPRIKPLFDCPEREVGLYAILRGFEVRFDECPNFGGSFRSRVREFINDMELESPGTKYSILRGFEKIQPLLDENKEKLDEGEVVDCEICAEPSSDGLCKACELAQKLGII